MKRLAERRRRCGEVGDQIRQALRNFFEARGLDPIDSLDHWRHVADLLLW
jgi:hypothetical protein